MHLKHQNQQYARFEMLKASKVLLPCKGPRILLSRCNFIVDSSSTMQYEKVPDAESSSDSLLHQHSTCDSYEQPKCLREPKLKRAWRSLRDEWPRPARILLTINTALSIVLLCLYLHALWRIHSSPFYRAPKPPYCRSRHQVPFG